MAGAQTVPSSVQPGHERQQFTAPPAPLSRPAGPLLKLPELMAPESAARVRLRIKSVTILGSTVYSRADLAPLYAGLVGRTVTAADVYALANKISAKYGQDGYLVARALVVPQTVDAKGAAIRIRIVEGYIETIEWPAEAARYRDLWTPCLAQIKAERPARTKTIERCLLLANDLPGLTFSSTLRAGTHNDGGSILVVKLAEKPVDLAVRVDNRGAHGQGPWEQTTTFTELNRLGLDESTTFTYAGALDTRELQFFGLNYHQVLTAAGLAFDFSASHSFGKPGLASLQAIAFDSNSTSFEGGLTYPVIRSREENLRLQALVFSEDALSHALGTPFSDDRLRDLRLRANFDEVDTSFGTLGLSQVIATFSHGFDGFGSTENGNPLASVAGGRVDFSKLEISANRTQVLGAGFSLFGALDAQWTGDTLLSAEQCTYGGRLYGRGFDPAALAGDRCLLELGELRYDIPIPGNPLTQTQLYGFADHGDLSRVAPALGTPAHSSGSSAGVGLRLAWKDNFSADFQVARAFDDTAGNGWRGFLVLTAHY